LRLTASSNFSADCTGNSPGLALLLPKTQSI
jgi:hypothetical protein